MPKALAGEVIVADFDHEFRLERHPFGGTLRRPAARTARRIAGKARRTHQRLQLFGERRLVLTFDRRGEPDMIEPAVAVIETEQQRADQRAALVVAEAADHTIGATQILDLLHAAAIAGAVGKVTTLGDDAIERRAGAAQPSLGFIKSGAGR